jgi:hypothetical protein
MLRQWRIDLFGFANYLTTIFSNRHQVVREVISNRVWHLGIVETEPERRPVFLVRGALWPDSPELMTGSGCFPLGAIVLHLSHLSPTRLTSACHWMPLLDCLTMENDGILLRIQGLEKASVADNYIRRDGRIWKVCFNGQTCLIPAVLGLEYLNLLVSKPNHLFTPLELVALVNHHVPEAAQAREVESLHADGSSGDSVMDENYVTDIRARLAELAARKNSGVISQAEEEERAKLQEHLRTATGLGGKTRKFTDSQQRARSSVTQAINRAVDQIGEYIPELKAHFRSRLDTGNSIIYRSDERTDWSPPLP